MSERHACRLLGQWRGTQRYEPIHRVDEDALTRAIIALGAKYGRYGYRRITALLRSAGWEVGKDRVQRIWRREGALLQKSDSIPNALPPDRLGDGQKRLHLPI